MVDCFECREKNREIERLLDRLRLEKKVGESLTSELMRYKVMFNKYDYTNTIEKGLSDNLSDGVISSFQKSLLPLNLELISTMTKMQLKETILLREGFYYGKMDEFEKNIKHNDREVFHNMKEEIQRLRRLLMDESIAYRESQRLKDRVQTLTNRIEGYKLQLKKRSKI